MGYKIVIEKPALKFLKKQQDNRDRIMKAIQGLLGIGDVKQMAGKEIFR